MAWTTPPTFSDGNVLSASQLNILSADLEHVYGLLQAAVNPFQRIEVNVHYQGNLWYFRYKHRYLHYKIVVTGLTHTSLTIKVDDTTVLTDATERAQGYTWQSYIDLEDGGLALGLTAGNLYNLYTESTFPVYNSGIMVHWFRLSGSTTL